MAQPFAILRNVGGLVFDATLKESHTLSIEVTHEPVETGNEIADHMYVKAKKLTIAAAVSDTPLSPLPNDPFAGERRSKTALDILQSLQESGEPFSIQTGLRLYTNMMCITLRAETDKDTERVLFFEADFEEVIIVSTQTVTYPPRAAGKTTRQASKKVTKGIQQSTTPPTSIDVKKYFAGAITNFFGGGK